MKLQVKFNDEVLEVEKNVKVVDVLSILGERIKKSACCVKIDGVVADLHEVLTDDCNLEVLTFDEEQGKRAFWHTTAHILAQAVQKLWPNAQFGVGPAIENGFFYDIKLQHRLTIDDLEKIENEMKQIVKQNLPLEKEVVDCKKALQIMQNLNQIYKVELIKELEKNFTTVTFYRQGDFVDLCKGPHLLSTKPVKAIKLVNVTGAYWKGDSKNEMLQRIYGISFPKVIMLEKYLNFLQEAKKRDHRQLGRDLELFSFFNEGVGFPFFLPNGMIIKNELISYWRKVHKLAGYSEISTPTILSRKLWEHSGHWSHYKSNMYETKIDDEEFAIKPMNCPGAVLVYGLKSHSYKDLPIRLGEFGVVHRHELSGTLHGLMRARCFTQDDAHIFLMENQIQNEVQNIIKLIDEIYRKFNFNYFVELSTMPDDHIGEVDEWEKATNALKIAIQNAKLSYKINEGDGAFYGPKIDFHIKDCLNRSWQCGTIQLDFQLPQRFNLQYVDSDGLKKRPILIHRVAYGSIERFIGILIEHFAGAFPLWLAPVQVVVLPVSQNFENYAKEVFDALNNENVRCKLDLRSEKVNYKIFQAQVRKIPYMLVVGEKEQTSKMVSVRQFGQKLVQQFSLKEFLSLIKQNLHF